MKASVNHETVKTVPTHSIIKSEKIMFQLLLCLFALEPLLTCVHGCDGVSIGRVLVRPVHGGTEAVVADATSPDLWPGPPREVLPLLVDAGYGDLQALQGAGLLHAQPWPHGFGSCEVKVQMSNKHSRSQMKGQITTNVRYATFKNYILPSVHFRF